MTCSSKRFDIKKVRLFVRERGKSAVRGTINACFCLIEVIEGVTEK